MLLHHDTLVWSVCSHITESSAACLRDAPKTPDTMAIQHDSGAHPCIYYTALIASKKIIDSFIPRCLRLSEAGPGAVALALNTICGRTLVLPVRQPDHFHLSQQSANAPSPGTAM